MKAGILFSGILGLVSIAALTGCDDDEVTYVAPVSSPVVQREVHSTYVEPTPTYSSTTTRRTVTAPAYVDPMETSTTVRRTTTTAY